MQPFRLKWLQIYNFFSNTVYLTLYTVLSGDRVLYPAFATLPLRADAVTCPAGTAFAEAEAESSILVMVIGKYGLGIA